jgi:hypothetical protein
MASKSQHITDRKKQVGSIAWILDAGAGCRGAVRPAGSSKLKAESRSTLRLTTG